MEQIFQVRAADSRHAPGYLAFGDSYWVAPGKYAVVFDFTLLDCPAEQPLHLDVAAFYGEFVVVEKDVSGRMTHQSVVLSFEAEEFLLIEPRVKFDGSGSVALKSVSITEQI